MMNERADQALFDRIAPRYARKDIVPSSSLARREQLLAALKPVLDERSNLGTVVDIGCGVGASARYLVDHYQRYVGIDHSSKMIEAAVAFNRDNPKAEFFAEDVKAEGLPQNEADLILSDGALHHMSDLGEAMEALARIAKPGAFLVAREPQNGNPFLQLMRWARGIVDRSYSRHQAYFSELELRSAAENHGINSVVVRFQGVLSPPFAQVVLHPQVLTVPLSRMAVNVDRWIDIHLSNRLKKWLSFNIVVIGRFGR